MNIKYFTPIGAENKRLGKLVGVMNQLYLYKLAPGEVLDDVYLPGFFNQIAEKIQNEDVLFVYSTDDTKYIAHKMSKNVSDEVTIDKMELDVNSIELDYIQFNTSPVVTSPAEGTVWWNGEEYTLNIETGLGPTLQIGQEQYILYYNNTGATISNGAILRPVGAFDLAGMTIPTPELAQADIFSNCEGTLGMATNEAPNGSLLFVTRFGRVRGIDTSALTPGADTFLSPTVPGGVTNVRPEFPDYSITLGGALVIDPASGEFFFNQTRDILDTFNNAWDGTVREKADFRVTSDGITVTGTLTNSEFPTRDLTLLFSDGAYMFDVTPGVSITLTPGTDDASQTNYVYIPKSTKTLTVSTSGWPSGEYARIADLEIQSATTTQLDGGTLKNQNINDEIKESLNNGHVLHITERIRRLNAEHEAGTGASLVGTPTNGYIDVTAGSVWQLHEQSFPAIQMSAGDTIKIVNDFTTPYRQTGNLNTITAYSDGSAWNNEWSKVVVWGIANKTGEPSFIMCNLPRAGYSQESSAINDSLNYADYTIPKKFKGTGFLMGSFVIRISAGQVQYNGGSAYQDLRGFVPNNIAGGGGGSGVTDLLQLTDVFETSYVGQAGKFLTVDQAENGVGFNQYLSINPADGDMTLSSDGIARITVDATNAGDQDPTFEFRTSGTRRARVRYDESISRIQIICNDASGFECNTIGAPYFPNISGSTGGSSIRVSTATGFVFYDTSALKYKENIVDATISDVNFIYNIEVKKYDRKDGSRTGEIGIIADSLVDSAPNLVDYGENGGVESYCKDDLVPYLVKIVQVQKDEIESLKTRVSALEGA